jgi:TonB-dependent receptor
MRQGDKKTTLNWGLALLGGVSMLALAQPALAQDETDTAQEEGARAADPLRQDVVIVEGIRASLAASSDLKRDAQGVIDAITAEDMGKFPDTNLAESLQRVTGVSIDRANGEGSTVTVRGFGPSFNLVLLNGRQMPTALLEGGAPASRSFDFGNLASEGIAGVDVYKSGRADLPTGGIGSTLNIKTARPLDAPGLRYSVGVKGVMDNSVTVLGDDSITPEISGIWSNTFANDTIGVAVAGSFQDRESGVAQFGTTSGWRGAYRGSENNWGTLPAEDSGRVSNRPGPDDIYSVPQNGNYQLTNVNRERINGQLALQYRPVESFTATLDYFYSQNTVDIERSDLSVWFNHGDTQSAWTDGPIASPVFYDENFEFTDLSMGAAKLGAQSENTSLGFNAEWQATDRLSFVFDAHNSTAESGPDSPFGTEAVLSTADFSLNFQGLDFSTELPSLSLGFQDGTDQIDAARMQGTGSTFQASTIKTEIDQYQLFGKYEFDTSIVKSVDFGVSSTTNTYRSTFSNNQRDSWGGVGSPEDYPDDIWTRADLAGNFDQFDGSGSTYPDFFIVDFDKLLSVMDQPIGSFGPVCGGDGICTNDTPLATDRRTEEESLAGFFQVNTEFDIGPAPASFVAGVRYEQTDVTSDALVGIPTGTAWVAANELSLTGLNDIENRDFTTLTGEYDYWLPNFDFRVEPRDDVVLRASYSRTLTRPSYADIQGGQTVAQLFRVDGGDGSSGNPNLEPFLSWNIDLSAEWYYGDDGGSYVSVGYFDKEVENFIGTDVFVDTPFDVFTPIGGARYNEAVAALDTTDADAIRQYIFNNADPSTFEVFFIDENGFVTGNIFGVPGEDPQVEFRISRPVNRDTKNVDGWEFAWQHFFGDSGFGFIANYTIVNGDVEFDNSIVPSDGVAQTPLIGLSDSYNLVGFYDKGKFQARLAYNWRGEFLTSAIGVSGAPSNPLYVEEYGQFDFNASYDVTERISVFVEGINITDETRRVIGRTPGYVNFATQGGSRYNFGARYTF